MFCVEVERPAEKKLNRLEPHTAAAIADKILALEDDPRPPGCKQIKGEGQDGWRIRHGKYRVLYLIDDAKREVVVYDVDLRDRVYKRKR
jgi:mRNA interferase RelE/StbE